MPGSDQNFVVSAPATDTEQAAIGGNAIFWHIIQGTGTITMTFNYRDGTSETLTRFVDHSGWRRQIIENVVLTSTVAETVIVWFGDEQDFTNGRGGQGGGAAFNGEVEFKDARNIVLANNPLMTGGISVGELTRALRLTPSGFPAFTPISNADNLADGNLGACTPDDAGTTRYLNILNNTYDELENSWARTRQNYSQVLLPNAARTVLPSDVDFQHRVGNALFIFINIVSEVGLSADFAVFPRDPISGALGSVNLVQVLNVATPGLRILVVNPGTDAFPGSADFQKSYVPKYLTLQVTDTAGTTATYSVSAVSVGA